MRLPWQGSGSTTPTYIPLDTRSTRNHGASGATVNVTFFSTAMSVLILLGVATFSFVAGQHLAPKSSPNALYERLQLHSGSKVFRPEALYTEKPNRTVNKAWMDLFPYQGGFFKHPEIAPHRSTFATFHQLHCLDGLRHAYWTLHGMAVEGSKVDEKDLPHHASPSHVGHCIDLLRQALMCQPDLAVEVQNDELGGVTGFGTEHTCINWGDLVAWTSHWESYEEYAEEPEDKEPDMGTHDY